MSDTVNETPPPPIISRRDFLKSLLIGGIATLTQRPNPPRIDNQTLSKGEMFAHGDYIRLESLKRLLEIDAAKSKPLGLRIIELDYPGNTVNQKYLKWLGMVPYAEAGEPLYLAVSEPIKSERDGEDVIWLVASDRSVFKRGQNPIPKPGLVNIARNNQGFPDIHPESVEIPLQEARGLETTEVNPADFEGYLNHLMHLAGADLKTD